MPDLSVWPTDGGDGSVSSEARWRKMARLWVPSGVAKPADLVPTLAAGPTINVTIGQCWLDGHFAELTAPASVPATATGLMVVRFTPADNHAELLYRDAATTPTQTDPTWELPIAQMTAGALADRRMRAGSTPAYPNYATLKLNRPAPLDGEQAVTLDDGRTWTYRALAGNAPNIGALPSARWEVLFNQTWPFATDVNGLQTLTPASFGLDGFANIQAHAGWDATAPVLMVGVSRLNSVSSAQLRVYSATNATGTGTIGVKASFSGTMYLTILGYRV